MVRIAGPWLAFVSPIFLIAAFVAEVLAIGFSMADFSDRDSPHLPFPQVDPVWIGVAAGGAAAGLGLLLVSLALVMIDFQSIDRMPRHSVAGYFIAGSTVASLVAFALLLAEWRAGAAFLVAYTVLFIVGSGGVTLLAAGLLALRVGALGAVLPWIGLVTGALLLFAILCVVAWFWEGLWSFLAVFPLFTAWSVWLGLRLRIRSA